jgi:hypothetical protein
LSLKGLRRLRYATHSIRDAPCNRGGCASVDVSRVQRVLADPFAKVDKVDKVDKVSLSLVA